MSDEGLTVFTLGSEMGLTACAYYAPSTAQLVRQPQGKYKNRLGAPVMSGVKNSICQLG